MDQNGREKSWTEENGGQWTKEQAKQDRRFDFEAFLGPDSLEDRVTDVLDGKDVLREGPLQSDYVPRRAAAGERGRHEAPGPDPEEEEEPQEDLEPEESFDDGLDTRRFDQDGALPPRTAPGAPPEFRQENAAPRFNVDDPPPRPKVVVAEPAPRVVVTPQQEYPDDRSGGGGGGKGMKWLMALLISLVIVAVVVVAVVSLLPGGGSSAPQASPNGSSGLLDGLLRPLPTQPPATQQPPAAVTDPPVVHHTITVTVGPGGSVSPSGSVEVEAGRSVSFTIAPDPGYELSQLLVDGALAALQDTYTFSDVERDHTLYAVFQPAQTAPPTAEPTEEPTPEPTDDPGIPPMGGLVGDLGPG